MANSKPFATVNHGPPKNATLHESRRAKIGISSSLLLLRIPSLDIVVRFEDGFEDNPGKRVVRANFQYSGIIYCFKVTDPKVEIMYMAKADGTYRLKDAIICVSLSELFHGYVFKLVAMVMTQGMMV